MYFEICRKISITQTSEKVRFNNATRKHTVTKLDVKNTEFNNKMHSRVGLIGRVIIT